MRGPQSRLLLWTQRPRPICLLSRQLVRNLYTSISSQKPHDPSPSELLRFTLTDSTKPVQSAESDAALSANLQGLFSNEWKSNSPPASLWTALKGLTPHSEELLWSLRNQVTDLSSLQRLIEVHVNDERGAESLQHQNCTVLRQALQRCQRQNTLPEILSVIGDVVARLNRLRLPVQSGICTLGVSFAMLDLSASAVSQFLKAHLLAGLPASGLLESVRIVRNCSEALDCKAFECPDYDKSHMLALITGEGDLVSQNHPRLHDYLYWTQPSDQKDIRYNCQLDAQDYLCLLAKLGSDEVLEICWGRFLKNIQPKNHHSCLAAYQVVLALIQTHRSEMAVKYLEDVSQDCGDNLPFIASFTNLQAFIDDPLVGEALPDLVRGEDYLELLEARLGDIEQRMGIQWHHECQGHSGVAPGPQESIWEAFGDEVKPGDDHGSTSSGHEGQLCAELRAYGCSESPAALARIVDLLHDHTGQSLEIVTHLDYRKERLQKFSSEFSGLQLRWSPEHSPIEFSDSRIPALCDSTKPSTPPNLGLIRARLVVGRASQPGVDSLHLMQLGCMDMRYGPDEPWQPSGYIVVWDRHFGELLGLYVGQTSGVIDSGPAPVGPLGALMHIRLSSHPEEQALSSSGTATHPRNCWGPYHLDIDPSSDLNLELPSHMK